LSLAIVDLDHFKLINDNACPHATGDEVLQQIGQFCCRRRPGGDENRGPDGRRGVSC